MSSGTPAWAVVLTALTALIAAVGQLFFKRGAATVSPNLSTWLLNPQLLIGLAVHAVGFVFIVVALRHGRLSVLFPVLATSYIWGVLLAARYLGEPITLGKWAGVGLILSGVALIVR